MKLGQLFACVAVGFALFLAVGCQKGGESLPALQTVKGTVTRGTQVGGPNWQISFVPTVAQDISVKGVTDAQGNFELFTTNATGDRKAGAPEGSYSVTVMTELDANQAGGEVIKLPKKYEIKAGANELKLEVPAKKK
jgi:hypothetical protein